jgi:hypothetical protein
MIRKLLWRYAARLRYPRLVAVTFGLFLLDLLVPDPVPFADEILLGLMALVLAGLKEKKQAISGRRESNPSGVQEKKIEKRT